MNGKTPRNIGAVLSGLYILPPRRGFCFFLMITQTNGSKMCIWRDSRDFNGDIMILLKSSKWGSTLRRRLLFKRILFILSLSIISHITYNKGQNVEWMIFFIFSTVSTKWISMYIYMINYMIIYVYICMDMWWDVYVCTYHNVCALLYTTWMCQEVAEENQKHSAAVRIQSFVSCRDLVWFGRISSTRMGAWKVDTREVRPGRSDRWVMLGKHDSPKRSTAVIGAYFIVPIF